MTAPSFSVPALAPTGRTADAPLPGPRPVEGGENLTDPVDDIHLWSCAEVAVIRNMAADAHHRIAQAHAEFAEAIAALTADADGWDQTQRLTQHQRAEP